MSAAVAFGLGVLVGLLGAFGAGRRYERYAHEMNIARGHLRVARGYGGQAFGRVLGVGLLVVIAVVAALIGLL